MDHCVTLSLTDTSHLPINTNIRENNEPKHMMRAVSTDTVVNIVYNLIVMAIHLDIRGVRVSFVVSLVTVTEH